MLWIFYFCSMKNILFLFFSVSGILAFSQQVTFHTVFNDKISIRAIEMYDNKVWYSGTDSKFGFVDLKNPRNQKQITISDKKLQFRTLAQDKNSFYTINIESPAYFFKISKKDLKPEIIFTDTVKTAFYDALHFVDAHSAYAFSDPDKDGYLKLAFYKDNKWIAARPQGRPRLNEGEAAFAASNTNIASSGSYVWLATGGKTSRIFKFRKSDIDHWKLINTPIVQGMPSQGVYSIDFCNDRFGIAAGGDYTKQEENVNNIATTHDGGETWQIQASGKNAGYTTCVKIRPGSEGKEIIAVGDRHISFSSDYGKTWKVISDEKNLYTCQWADTETVVLAGKDRIAVMTLKF